MTLQPPAECRIIIAMSARDWRTIGVNAPRKRIAFPSWMGWTLPPLAIPLITMAWMAAAWDRIPLRFVTHYGPGNVPDRWQTRTPLHVFGLPIFAEGLAALIAALVYVTWVGSGKRAGRSPMEKIPVAAEYLVSLVFSAVGLLTVLQLPVWPVGLAAPVTVIGVLVYVAKVNSEAEEVEEATPAGEPLFVHSPYGRGYVLNFSNRWAGRFLLGLFGGIGILTAFLVWSMQ
jgi:uncharacterized membrane protein